jgi:protein polybromo-1
MFNNCRLFNEEGSLIYEDANKLETILKRKIKELGPEPGKKKKYVSVSALILDIYSLESIKLSFDTKSFMIPYRVKKSPILVQKLNDLLNTVKDYTDKSGRVLSAIFQKLPSKNVSKYNMTYYIVLPFLYLVKAYT